MSDWRASCLPHTSHIASEFTGPNGCTFHVQVSGNLLQRTTLTVALRRASETMGMWRMSCKGLAEENIRNVSETR